MQNNQRNPGDPMASFWAAACRTALAVLVLLAGFRAALLDTGYGNPAEWVFGLLVGTASVAIALLVLRLGARLFGKLPGSTLCTLAALVLATWFLSVTSPAEILRTLLEPGEWQWPLHLPHGYSVPAVLAMILTAGLAGGVAGCRPAATAGADVYESRGA